MSSAYHFYIVDDDRISIRLMTRQLEAAGHRISSNISGTHALSEIIEQRPDAVLLDIMMPEMDGLEILKRLRNERSLDETRIVVVSGKSYEFDRKQALKFGADGYITKPIDTSTFARRIERIVQDRIELSFWGVHGTLPVPGPETNRYGGNTSCVSLDFARGNLFVFDAGSGIKVLSDALLKENKRLKEAKIFISHPHWDHINALPFFGPLYIPGNEIEICGPSQGDISMREMISGQMDGVYFPIKIKEFGATISFRDLKEEVFDVDGIKIRTMLLNHPGHCLGYRVDYNGRSVCYLTDNEIYPETSPYYNTHYIQQLEEFVGETDAWVTDTTYLQSEYESKTGWGHSTVEQVAALAHRAKVKALYLYHHDIDHTDVHIDTKLGIARAILAENGSATQCIAPREKDAFQI